MICNTHTTVHHTNVAKASNAAQEAKVAQANTERINKTHRVLHICLSSGCFGQFETRDLLYAIFKQEFVYSGHDTIVRYLSNKKLVKTCHVAYLCAVTSMVIELGKPDVGSSWRPTMAVFMKKIEDFGIKQIFRDLEFIIGHTISEYITYLIKSNCFVINADNGGFMQLFHKLFGSPTNDCASRHTGSTTHFLLIIHHLYAKYNIIAPTRAQEITYMLFMLISDDYIKKDITAIFQYQLKS